MSIDPKLRELNIDLPACPATLVKLSLMMADENASIADMAILIEADMALASAVVRTVNSAMFGLLKRVETVHDAVRYLGMAQVASLTYEMGLRGAFPPTPLLQTLWDRAGIRGMAMGRIARQLDVDPWMAHTMGLFAETGRAVLYAYDRTQYTRINEGFSGSLVDEAALSAAEIEAFGVSHAALGAAMCQSWGLAREIADGVRTRLSAPSQWGLERPVVRKLLAIGAAVDALLLDPERAAKPQTVWAEMQTTASEVGLHFEAFQLATTRVCERLTVPA
jgi:HD-like signal output (HDOD) protein